MKAGCLVSRFSSIKAQWQVGMRSSMRERRSRHDRTCLWQFTVLMAAALPTVVYDMVVLVEDGKAYQVLLEVVWFIETTSLS